MTLHIMTKKTSPKCIQWKKAKCTTVYAVCYAIFWDKEGWNNKVVFPICLYMHTMNLEGWDKTLKEVTNSGYKGRRKGDFIVHLVIFCEFWTICYPWKMLKNKRLTNLPKFTELECGRQSWHSNPGFQNLLSNIPLLDLSDHCYCPKAEHLGAWWRGSVVSPKFPFSELPEVQLKALGLGFWFSPWGSTAKGIHFQPPHARRKRTHYEPTGNTPVKHISNSTKIRLIIFFAVKDGEALYSRQKQDRELTMAQIMN